MRGHGQAAGAGQDTGLGDVQRQHGVSPRASVRGGASGSGVRLGPSSHHVHTTVHTSSRPTPPRAPPPRSRSPPSHYNVPTASCYAIYPVCYAIYHSALPSHYNAHTNVYIVLQCPQYGLTASCYVARALGVAPPIVMQNDYSIINRRIEEQEPDPRCSDPRCSDPKPEPTSHSPSNPNLKATNPAAAPSPNGDARPGSAQPELVRCPRCSL